MRSENGPETQQSIAGWAEQTFGPVSDATVLVDRAAIELAELREAVKNGDIQESGKEAADVTILLFRLMQQLGLDLDTEVTGKMAENRARRWLPKGDGTGSHIK